jgi:hypothetical protein
MIYHYPGLIVNYKQLYNAKLVIYQHKTFFKLMKIDAKFGSILDC